MIGPAMDRGGLKDSETAPNSFFPKINRTVFWHLGTDMLNQGKKMASWGIFITIYIRHYEGRSGN